MVESTQEDLVIRISKLTLNQRRLITEILDEFALEDNIDNSGSSSSSSIPEPPTDGLRGTALGPNSGIRSVQRKPNFNFISANNCPLSIGDRVELLTTRVTGRSGDLAIVIKFNKKYVAVELVHNKAVTQRASKFLAFIE